MKIIDILFLSMQGKNGMNSINRESVQRMKAILCSGALSLLAWLPNASLIVILDLHPAGVHHRE